MRKILISLLLASAAASPAIAGPQDSSDRQQAREDRQQAREERAASRDEARAQRSAERASSQAQTRAEQPRPQPVDRQQFSRPDRAPQQVDLQALRAQQNAYAAQRGAYAAQRGERIEQVQQRFEQRQQDRVDARDLRQATRPTPNVMRDRRPPVVSDTPRFGTQPPLRAQSRVQWNTNWRNDNHYDWRRYRDHHRSRFHLGVYFDPFGWGYQPFSIGYRMWPAYYGNQFWIDPGLYGLPYPPPGAAWIRYYNDAMLIDTYTGTVIDVIPSFFW